MKTGYETGFKAKYSKNSSAFRFKPVSDKRKQVLKLVLKQSTRKSRWSEVTVEHPEMLQALRGRAMVESAHQMLSSFSKTFQVSWPMVDSLLRKAPSHWLPFSWDFPSPFKSCPVDK